MYSSAKKIRPYIVTKLSEKKYKKEKNRGAASFFFSELNFLLVFKLSQQAQIHLWADMEHHAGSPHHHLISFNSQILFSLLLPHAVVAAAGPQWPRPACGMLLQHPLHEQLCADCARLSRTAVMGPLTKGKTALFKHDDSTTKHAQSPQPATAQQPPGPI
jgi:hypothetical protein